MCKSSMVLNGGELDSIAILRCSHYALKLLKLFYILWRYFDVCNGPSREKNPRTTVYMSRQLVSRIKNNLTVVRAEYISRSMYIKKT